MSSPTAQIFIDIKTRLEGAAPYFPYPATLKPSKTGNFVFKWNDSVKKMKEGKYFGLNLPLIFIDMQVTQVDQLGNGCRQRKMSFKIHCCHRFYNATDGLVKFDQDLDIYYFRDWIFQMLEMFKPAQCGVLTLVDEPGEESHDMITDYILEFSCLHTDSLVDQPINGSFIIPTPSLDEQMTIVSNYYTDENGNVLTDETDIILTPSI